MLGLTFVLLVSIFCESGHAACSPVEEGQSTNITCKAERCLDLDSNDFQWYSNFTLIAECVHGACSKYPPHEGFSVANDNSVSTLTIQDVHRNGTLNLETYWSCIGACFEHSVACKALQVYALPESPACSVTQIQDSGGRMTFTLTCSTSKVYPQASCKFSWLKSDGTSKPVDSRVAYKHTATEEMPVYYSSNCTVTVSHHGLGVGTYNFQGYIYPDVDGGENLVQPLDIIDVNVDDLGKTKDQLLPPFDNLTLIAGGAAIFIIVVLFIVIIALVCQNRRRKPKMRIQERTLTTQATSRKDAIEMNDKFSRNNDRPESCEVDGSPSPNYNHRGRPSNNYVRSLSPSSNAATPSQPSIPRPSVLTTQPPENPIVSASTPPSQRPFSGYVLPSDLLVDSEAISTSFEDGSRPRSGNTNRAFDNQDKAEYEIYENESESRKGDVGHSEMAFRGQRGQDRPTAPKTRWRSRVPPVPQE